MDLMSSFCSRMNALEFRERSTVATAVHQDLAQILPSPKHIQNAFRRVRPGVDLAERGLPLRLKHVPEAG
jgi:hypothetical protein